MAEVALQLSGVSAGYGSTEVLREVDLVVPGGGVVAVLGPNGAGKTTLLRAAAGTLPVRSGSIELLGLEISSSAPAQRACAGLCLIPEGRGVFANLTVRENLRLFQPPKGNAPPVDEVLDVFPVLRQKIDRPAGEMSGGQQQMLALARAWLARPSIVLLDEVSMGLAPLVVDEIFSSLDSLRQTGTSLLLVEQYVDRALAMADQVYLLMRGRATHAGPPASLDRDALLDRYLGVPLAG